MGAGCVINKTLKLYVSLFKCYIWSAPFYTDAKQGLSQVLWSTLNTLQSADMWFLRRMLELSRTSHDTNDEYY